MTPQHLIHQAALRTPPPKHLAVMPGTQRAGIRSMEKFTALCEKHGVDPADALLKLLKKDDLDLKDKELADVYLKMMEYTRPKLKSVEQTGKDGGPVEHTFRWEK